MSEISQEEMHSKAIEIGKLLNGLSVIASKRVLEKVDLFLYSNSVVSFKD